jgi:hypothetical protein
MSISDAFNSRLELRNELLRLVNRLARHIEAQRRDGRTLASDPLRGLAIEEGEAEQLIGELAADLAQPPAPPKPAANHRSPLDLTECLQETPLRRAERLFQLHPPEFNALLLALAVEIDIRFARLVAFLNDHISRPRPTIGLALALSGPELNAADFCGRPALRFGLLRTEGDGPLSALVLRVAPEMLTRLVAPSGDESLPRGVRLRPGTGPSLDAAIIDPHQGARLHRWSANLAGAPKVPPLLLAGSEGAGRATLVQAASEAAGRRLIEVAWTADGAEKLEQAGREAFWHQTTLLVRVGDGVGSESLAALWAELSKWEVPLALAISPALIEAARAAAPVPPVVLEVQPLGIEQRDTLWQRLLAGPGTETRIELSEAERGELAARYDFLPGQLARALQSAVAEHELTGTGGALGFKALSLACRAIGSAGIGPLAQRLPQPYTRRDLVLPQHLLDELDLASSWMKNRRRVFEDWGFSRRLALGQGLTALFTGEPGTGKTMAAQVLARELGLELFRIDLSRVMSKYIGETEKNLSRLFDDARASGAILFFDEADALFGKRSEVKDAHDRYANLEIGYLLQRMEEHTGTTVLATNRARDLDEAFTRRFHFIMDFPMPGPSERRRIWEGMLPPEAEREAEIDLESLASDYEISGGEIRNSVLSAAFIAAADGLPLGLRHLKRGLRRELLKTGRVLDSRQRQALEGD